MAAALERLSIQANPGGHAGIGYGMVWYGMIRYGIVDVFYSIKQVSQLMTTTLLYGIT